MVGKDKCKALKEIRRQIAEKNDIPYITSQCTYQGECSGTCPKCESELAYLERELRIKQDLGKAVAVVGLCTTLAACGPQEISDSVTDLQNIQATSELDEQTDERTEKLKQELKESFKNSAKDNCELTGGAPVTEESESLLDKLFNR